MWLLIVAFVLGCLALIASAREGRLEEAVYKAEINRMADASRKGKPAPVRQRSRYTVAGIRAK